MDDARPRCPARPPGASAAAPADRVPVPCPRAGGLREMGERRAGEVAVAAAPRLRHVPFLPVRARPDHRPARLAAGQTPQLCPPTRQFNVRATLPRPAS